jgi:hypothetical protein
VAQASGCDSFLRFAWSRKSQAEACANKEDAVRSEIHLLGFVALYVPAWAVAEVWEDRVCAGLGFWFACFVLGFTVLLGYRVELGDLAGSGWIGF